MLLKDYFLFSKLFDVHMYIYSNNLLKLFLYQNWSCCEQSLPKIDYFCCLLASC